MLLSAIFDQFSKEGEVNSGFFMEFLTLNPVHPYGYPYLDLWMVPMLSSLFILRLLKIWEISLYQLDKNTSDIFW
jgi:hypothetical protein